MVASRGESCQSNFFPMVVTLAGGYATALQETVEIHCTTIRTAARLSREA